MMLCPVCDKEITQAKLPHLDCYAKVHRAFFFFRERGFRKDMLS